MNHHIEKEVTKKFLESLDQISFTVIFWDGEECKIGKDEPTFHATIHKPFNKANLMKSTSLELAEAVMRKDIEIEGDLYQAMDAVMSQFFLFTTKHSALPHIYKKNHGEKEQKKDIAYHYDIGNDFYSLWLDDTLSYSCAYFEHEDDTLYQAQMNKIHHLLRKLNLKEGMSLLDIGCGWGYLLIEAAKIYHVNGVGITLSEEQAKEFKHRIKEEHLEDLLEVRIMDYEELKNSGMQFDRIISVGMLEHVGREHYPMFFDNVNAVLKQSGIFVLHYISAFIETKGDAFIKKYIFPGGIIPSLREIIYQAAEMHYQVIDVESLRRHYWKTLLCWYHNFNEHIGEVAEKFDESFIRMWQLYLACCAAAFHNGVVDLHQIVMTKGTLNDLPMTRAYLYS